MPTSIIHVYNRGALISSSEYFCDITTALDKYNEYIHGAGDNEYRPFMRTYIMPPDQHGDDYYIPIRVPGATRGHIQVKPNTEHGCWEVVEVMLYHDTAIVGKSLVGCYKPEITDILDSFIGTLIDFEQHNPKGDKHNGN